MCCNFVADVVVFAVVIPVAVWCYYAVGVVVAVIYWTCVDVFYVVTMFIVDCGDVVVGCAVAAHVSGCRNCVGRYVIIVIYVAGCVVVGVRVVVMYIVL